jgi:pimeloyl-ACP methyl ester carboxylesterase
MTEPPPDSLPGERLDLGPPGLPIACYRAQPAGGSAARPLLLVHSVNAAASAAEMRPLHDHYGRLRPVYAPDLPGFGLSDRSARDYTPRLMTDALHTVLESIAREHGPGPVDAIALSLGCEFLARAAVERPTTLRSLALVSPTGFSGQRRRRGPPGSTLQVGWLYRALSRPWLGEPLYRALTRPAVIRYFLRRTFGRREIDETLWALDVATARAPGAWRAPVAFLSAGLFSGDANTLYEALHQPVWMCHGVRGDFTDYRGRDSVEGRANWRFEVFDSGAIPWFEDAAGFVRAYDRFGAAVDAGLSPSPASPPPSTHA